MYLILPEPRVGRLRDLESRRQKRRSRPDPYGHLQPSAETKRWHGGSVPVIPALLSIGLLLVAVKELARPETIRGSTCLPEPVGQCALETDSNQFGSPRHRPAGVQAIIPSCLLRRHSC
ncbi:hypothetical protein Oant_3253 [Brucella anthropi ATCC 49188]|uniref:Uncharacterized protein n=1 Tax=Brucella anthropi (strain ATCC 49188 / DSM 6882 / CCUG 24695 / JCM 21032 / LMG 3331 / NBRC 15819 / NCTC 12168 / Alc 37) TaxID=439375 RepID=A6X407_BRUA4|nr:hypothetical protein Oant_3253 [Brucella anthropi ATCC 49188]